VSGGSEAASVVDAGEGIRDAREGIKGDLKMAVRIQADVLYSVLSRSRDSTPEGNHNRQFGVWTLLILKGLKAETQC
jgi:hypothetical protein